MFLVSCFQGQHHLGLLQGHVGLDPVVGYRNDVGPGFRHHGQELVQAARPVVQDGAQKDVAAGFNQAALNNNGQDVGVDVASA